MMLREAVLGSESRMQGEQDVSSLWAAACAVHCLGTSLVSDPISLKVKFAARELALCDLLL